MVRSWMPLFAAALLCLPAPSLAQSVQLADGRVLLAEIEPGSVSGEGLRVRRLDNDGVLDLRWDHLSAASALEWKKKFDLAGDTQDEVTVRADEIEYIQKGGKQTLIGRVVEPGADPIVVQSKGVTYSVKRTDLKAMRKVDVPVGQVLTKEEYYNELRAQIQPGGEADKHVQLAEQLMRVRNYDRALEHVEQARQLDNSKNKAHIESLQTKLVRFKEAEKELKLLEDIQAARSRGGLGDFEAGTRLIAQFEKDFPQTKLKEEFASEKRRFADKRKNFLTGQVAEKFREGVRFIAERQEADKSLTLQAVRDYAQSKMTDDIVDRVAKQLRLPVEEVKQLWASRKDTALGKRTEHFQYGVGSWVLGEKAILKDTEQGRANEKQKGTQAAQPAKDPQTQKLLKALQDAMERRRAAVQRDQGASREQTDEDWWREAVRADRVGWLRAFYAEFGGQLVVTFATVSPCVSCYAEGNLPEIGGDGKTIRTKCFLCQGQKWVRSFKAY
jgi:hypothetical protein